MSVSTPPVNDRIALQRWLPYCRLDAGRPRVRLLCFAHAGGSAFVFQKWPEKLPWTVQVCAVQLPGREQRLNEPFVKHMPKLIEELSHALLSWMDRPVALLGHSLGAKIAFEFARCIRSQVGAPEIVHLFVSGSRAPHLRPSAELPIYNLPEEQFVQRLRQFGGTPQDVLADSEIMQFLAPRLRSDFELDNTYTFEPRHPLACPITAWAGDSDGLVPAASLQDWGQHTTGVFQAHILKGAHFSFYERECEIIPRIRQALSGHP